MGEFRLTDDLISRRELIKEMCVKFYREHYYAGILNVIYKAPPVESEDNAIQYTKGYQDGFLEGKKLAERPHGEWIRKPNEHRVDICCTNCGYDDGYSCFKFCPNCGADMRGAKK